MNKSNLFVAPTKDKNGNLQFFSPSGEKVRIKYIWNETRDKLVEKEKIDIIAEINERAKGTSIVEQIARLNLGDTSVIDPSRVTPEDFSADVSGMPESSIEIIDQVVQARAAVQELKAAEESARAEREELKKMKDDIIAKKQAYDAAVKAFDAQKASAESAKKDGE